MKVIQESLFMSSLRAFFVALFGFLGALVALAALTLILAGIFSASEEHSFSSDVSLLPNAQGNREKLGNDTPIILQIDIQGPIGGESLNAKKIEEMLLNSREDAFEKDRVKAILLTINSPGGGVNDSDIIYRHLKAYKEQYGVPIYAFVGGMCASGGYYIACASDRIFASDVSLVGSIGVLTWPPFMNVHETLEKIGVHTTTLYAGKGKDEMNPFRPWKEEEPVSYQRLTDFYYNRFVSIVADARPVARGVIEEQIGAEVIPAPVAEEIGLIDVAGSSRNEALEALAAQAGITESYQVVGFSTSSWWKKLFKEQTSSPLITGRVKHELSIPQGTQGNPFSYLFVTP